MAQAAKGGSRGSAGDGNSGDRGVPRGPAVVQGQDPVVPGLWGGQELPNVHQVGEGGQTLIQRATLTVGDWHRSDKAALKPRGQSAP